MTALPLFGPAPDRVLCQTDRAGCAACCGTYNFDDRHTEAFDARLLRRRALVRGAGWDKVRLAAVRDQLLAEEAPHRLTDMILSCPYAGPLDDAAGPGDPLAKVGCLIHPARHPTGEDVRDLAVHPREVCAGHFCAPHEWLTPREKDFAARGTNRVYANVVTDAGLCKALVRCIEWHADGPVSFVGPDAAQPALDALFSLLQHWPHRDPDPRRFGAYVLDERADERRVDDPLAAVGVEAERSLATVVAALSSRFADADAARRALDALDDACAAVARALRPPGAGP